MRISTGYVFGVILASMLIFSCSPGHQADLAFMTGKGDGPRQDITWPDARFAVFTDTHFHSRELGTSGDAFEKYLAGDRKLLRESEEILARGIERINREKVDFVLVPGDLTKDGEVINHKKVVAYLSKLSPGVKAYVVPGNHDIRSSEAVKYTGDKTKKVKSVEPEQFRDLYDSFGYGEAIHSDESSLSYVAEPVKGLWLLALDSCLWRENTPHEYPKIDGRFTPETLEWIEEMLVLARDKGKGVIAFMHHGAMEHYPTNEENYGEYVVDNSEVLSRMFAYYGVRTVFTGHFHAQDITVKNYPVYDASLYDIETGSFVTWPCPYRVVDIRDSVMNIKSRYIKSIPSHPDDFQEFARQYVFDGTVGLARDALEGYHVPEKDIKLLAPQIARAYLAHLEGDETMPEKPFSLKDVSLMGKVVGWLRQGLVYGWWTDLPPADNELVIDLRTGKIREKDKEISKKNE